MSWSTQRLTLKGILMTVKAGSMNSGPIWPARWVWGCGNPPPPPEASCRPKTCCTKTKKKQDESAGVVFGSWLAAHTYEVAEGLEMGQGLVLL